MGNICKNVNNNLYTLLGLSIGIKGLINKVKKNVWHFDINKRSNTSKSTCDYAASK